MNAKRLPLFLICTVGLGALAALSRPAAAQDPCACASSSCNPQGFVITLTAHQIDQLNGSSTWTYQICNQTAGCYCEAQYQNVEGQCHGLSHIDVSLPGLGTCLTPTQSISFAQVSGVESAIMSCSVSQKDPSCDLSGTLNSDFVAKCDVSSGDLDPGECVSMLLTIAGERPTLGQGAASTVTKAATDCATDAICGPACDCGEELQDACLTRSPGFWGNHPAITSQFLPITVCGVALTSTTAGTCFSVTEALCVSPGLEANRRLDRNTPYAALVRQLAAAKLNLAATAANGGDCGSHLTAARIAECEGLCGASKTRISASGCIEDLDRFNNDIDTFSLTPPPFDAPGSANPAQCQAASGNGIVINKRCTVP